jgi:hypothetical protein
VSERPLIDAAARAVRNRSVADLQQALVLYIQAKASDPGSDYRDLFIGLAPFYDAALRLGAKPTAVFDRATAGMSEPISELVRIFSERTDVTLHAFGWSYEESASAYVPLKDEFLAR